LEAPAFGGSVNMILKRIDKRTVATSLVLGKACVIIFLAWLFLLSESQREVQGQGGAEQKTAAAKSSVGAASLTAQQVLANPETLHQRLKAKNPGYGGAAQFANEPALGLVGDLSGTTIKDISPLRGIPFGALDLKGLPITNIDPLRGMPLKALALEETGVTDLKPLKGMKLEKLYLNNVPVTDLTPLAGMPLKELQLVGTKVKDLSPLRDVPLEQLWLNGTPVTDISSLAGCPLISLTLDGTKVSDLTPLSRMATLRRLHIAGTPVRDLTPLQGLALTRLIFTPSNITKGIEAVRGMKSITELGPSLQVRMPPEKFWALYDQAKK
jgi:internalin A